jgi:integrase/recombinase XerD
MISRACNSLAVHLPRISEALQLPSPDLLDYTVHLRGKGRKELMVPFWPRTERRQRQWCKTNSIAPEQLIFTERSGEPLSRDGITSRLALAVRTPVECPSLNSRRITYLTIQHSCARSLLQVGVAMEVIALWLGHAEPQTTNGYMEADLKMKAECLTEPTPPRRRFTQEFSRLVELIEAI